MRNFIVQIIHMLTASYCSVTKLCLILIMCFDRSFSTFICATHKFQIADYPTFLHIGHLKILNLRSLKMYTAKIKR